MGHGVKGILGWETFQALTRHATANTINLADLAAGIRTPYDANEHDTHTRWSSKESELTMTRRLEDSPNLGRRMPPPDHKLGPKSL